MKAYFSNKTTFNLAISCLLLLWSTGKGFTNVANETCPELDLIITDMNLGSAEGEIVLDVASGVPLTNYLSVGDYFSFDYSILLNRELVQFILCSFDNPAEGSEICSSEGIYCAEYGSSYPSITITGEFNSIAVVAINDSQITVNSEILDPYVQRNLVNENPPSESSQKYAYPSGDLLSYMCNTLDTEHDPNDFNSSFLFTNPIFSSGSIQVEATIPEALDIQVEIPTGSYCTAIVSANLKDDLSDYAAICGDLVITEIQYSLEGYTGITQILQDPNVNNSGQVEPYGVTFSVGGANTALKGVITYTVSCNGGCLETFTVTSENNTVIEPSIDLNIIPGTITECTLGFNYEVAGFDEDDCYIIGQTWTFESTTSEAQAPIYEFEGEGSELVILSVEYVCPSCTGDLVGTATTQVEIDIPDLLTTSTVFGQSSDLEEVISVGTSSFSSAWPLFYQGSEDEQDLHPYKSAQAGVWRQSGTQVYNSGTIVRSTENDLSSNGTFDAVQFNWLNYFKDVIPEWLTINTVTGYNSQSMEVENRDVLDVPSAAIFGHGGMYPIAVGANMANQEMAFTSFEDVDAAGVTGNFLFGNGTVDVPYRYEIVSGKSNVIVIEEDYTVLYPILDLNTEPVKIISDDHVVVANVVCHGEDAGDFPGTTYLVLDERISNETYFYGGTLLISNSRVGNSCNGDNCSIETEWSHTGSKCLFIGADSKKLSQPILRLEPNQKYMLDAWVSIDKEKVYYTDIMLTENLEIDVLFTLPDDASISGGVAVLSGPIVEGWQKVEGVITVPEEGYIDLKFDFKRGNATQAYFDDLRIYPLQGNMQGYVYDNQFRLSATMDENNYATFYDYDGEGNLFLVRKETTRGIKTIQESSSNQQGVNE